MAGQPKQRRLSPRTTLKQKRRFLETYAKLGNATATAEETGISRDRHKYWLKMSSSYREAFEQADDQATERLEQEARRRALEGREEAVYWNGNQIGTVRKYSDVLLIFLLKAKKPDVYREIRTSTTANVSVQAAVKVVHEYHDQAPHMDVTAIETLPNRQLMGPTELPTITPDKAGGTADDLPASTPLTPVRPILTSDNPTED